MIKESTPLTLAEVSDLVGKGERAEKIKIFIKKIFQNACKKGNRNEERIKKIRFNKTKRQ